MTTTTDRKFKIGDQVRTTEIYGEVPITYLGTVDSYADESAVDCFADTCGDRPCVHGPYYWVRLDADDLDDDNDADVDSLTGLTVVLGERELRAYPWQHLHDNIEDLTLCGECMDRAADLRILADC